MDPVRPKFFQTAFEITHNENSLSLQGLVSPVGVTKVFLKAGLPAYWQKLIGKPVVVHLGQVTASGLLLQQEVEHGTFYEIKFVNIGEPVRRYLLGRIETQGVSPGWQRKFPRIPVQGIQDAELPTPNLCVIRFVGQETYVNVLNFTLGGLRIETLGDSLQGLRVGSVIHFDLIISTGEILSHLSAEVRNIATHDHGEEGQALTRSFGLRLLEMDPVNERKYRDLIRNYCKILQKRLLDER